MDENTILLKEIRDELRLLREHLVPKQRSILDDFFRPVNLENRPDAAGQPTPQVAGADGQVPPSTLSAQP